MSLTTEEYEKDCARAIAQLSPAQDALLEKWGRWQPREVDQLRKAYFHWCRFWTHGDGDPLDTSHFDAFVTGWVARRSLEAAWWFDGDSGTD